MRRYGRPLHKFIKSAALPAQGEFSSLDYDLWFSPDENGWFWQRAEDGKVSQLFILNTQAIDAMEQELEKPGIIEWS